MIKYNLILLFKLQLLLGQTQYANITVTTTTQTKLTKTTTSLSTITTTTKTPSNWFSYFPTKETTLKFGNNCSYGTVYNGNNCDGKVSIGN
jgi:hypothetical protein